jgi:hypothetical protein
MSGIETAFFGALGRDAERKVSGTAAASNQTTEPRQRNRGASSSTTRFRFEGRHETRP